MKTTIAVIGLGLLVSACGGGNAGNGGMPAAEIASMSDNRIAVVYYDSVSGMGDASRIAASHCDPMNAVSTGSAKATDTMVAVDRTVVSFECRPPAPKK